MKKFKKTDWFKPYEAANVCALKTTGAGVYFIRQNSVLLYVGYSANDVKKTMYRHFQKWTDLRPEFTKKMSSNDRVSFEHLKPFKGFSCKVVFTSTSEQAEALERALIVKLKPKMNSLKLDVYGNSEVMIKAVNEAAEIDVFTYEKAPF